MLATYLCNGWSAQVWCAESGRLLKLLNRSCWNPKRLHNLLPGLIIDVIQCVVQGLNMCKQCLEASLLGKRWRLWPQLVEIHIQSYHILSIHWSSWETHPQMQMQMDTVSLFFNELAPVRPNGNTSQQCIEVLFPVDQVRLSVEVDWTERWLQLTFHMSPLFLIMTMPRSACMS